MLSCLYRPYNLFNHPDEIGKSSPHRWCHVQCLVTGSKAVIDEVQAYHVCVPSEPDGDAAALERNAPPAQATAVLPENGVVGNLPSPVPWVRGNLMENQTSREVMENG
jgi:hypothetical protein